MTKLRMILRDFNFLKTFNRNCRNLKKLKRIKEEEKQEVSKKSFSLIISKRKD
jgi:hypothetical protein